MCVCQCTGVVQFDGTICVVHLTSPQGRAMEVLSAANGAFLHRKQKSERLQHAVPLRIFRDFFGQGYNVGNLGTISDNILE